MTREEKIRTCLIKFFNSFYVYYKNGLNGKAIIDNYTAAILALDNEQRYREALEYIAKMPIRHYDDKMGNNWKWVNECIDTAKQALEASK